MNPTFIQIWSDNWVDKWIHSQRYYRFRSTVRMAVWIPVTYLTVAMLLSLGA